MLAEKMNHLLTQLRSHRLWGTRIENLILGVLVVGLLWTLFAHFRTPAIAAAPVSRDEEILEIDQYVPDGYVLFPLEFENQAALDPLISDFAVVNIYRTSIDGPGRGKLVAKNVKIMRAPQNPQMLAALIPETQVSGMMSDHSGFYGVLQKKNAAREFQRAGAAKKAPTFTIQTFEN